MSIPYGLRDVKITPYLDAAGKVLSSQRIDLPVSQTFSFSEVEEFQTLRGDDRVAAEHGSGPSVEWSLGHGGISFEALKAMSGGEIITESGKRTFRKTADSVRPYFHVEGQAINDDGGDTHLVVYRCKTTGNIEGEFADGAFFVTSASGTGSPVPADAAVNANLLWDFVENDSATPIPATSAPRIVSITPSGAGEDDTVLLRGAGFSGATAVKFGVDDASSFDADFGDDVLTAVLPAGAAGSIVVTVITPLGTSNEFPYTRTI